MPAPNWWLRLTGKRSSTSGRRQSRRQRDPVGEQPEARRERDSHSKSHKSGGKHREHRQSVSLPDNAQQQSATSAISGRAGKKEMRPESYGSGAAQWQPVERVSIRFVFSFPMAWPEETSERRKRRINSAIEAVRRDDLNISDKDRHLYAWERPTLQPFSKPDGTEHSTLTWFSDKVSKDMRRFLIGRFLYNLYREGNAWQWADVPHTPGKWRVIVLVPRTIDASSFAWSPISLGQTTSQEAIAVTITGFQQLPTTQFPALIPRSSDAALGA